jgi:L-threonylcarbamoyladenylate synthase
MIVNIISGDAKLPETGIMERHTRLFSPEKEGFGKVMEEAGAIIRAGGVVAFPTETVYGLGAGALNPEAVGKIFRAKGRPADNPLIVHIAQKEQCALLAAEISPTAEKLMEAFWPGPLTLILKKKAVVPDITTAGLDSVAIRLPASRIARELILAAGTPIAAPSANTSGKPSPTSASHVLEDLDGRIEAIIDGGGTDIGIESTVVDARGDVPVILRPGKIAEEELGKVTGEVETGYTDRTGDKGTPLSPGMKYTHYSPGATTVLLEGGTEAVRRKIQEVMRENPAGKKTGLLLTEELQGIEAEEIISLGPSAEPLFAAGRIFGAMREMDRKGIEVILIDGSFTGKGIGRAVLNRLRKAADSIIDCEEEQ